MLMRWLSAIGGLIVLFGTLIFLGSQALGIVGSLVVLIAAYEYASLFEKRSLWFFLFLAFDILVYVTHIFKPDATLAALVGSFVALSSLGVFIFRNEDTKQTLFRIQWALWGLIYTGIFPALTVHLLVRWSWITLIYLLVTVFFGDVAAFFCGRYIGGPKIFPNISPKKTVSGAIGGLVASGFFGALCLSLLSGTAQLLPSIAMSLAIGFFAQFGDFFESLIKRVSGCKDSGQLMPGHGGFLDRLDGVYFGSAVFYVFCTTLGYIDYF